MQANELFPHTGFRPSSPQELVEAALACADKSAGDSSSTKLEQLSDEAWSRDLLTVAWVLYRQLKHYYHLDEDGLKTLANYLASYQGGNFLNIAASLIQIDEKGWWHSPRLPDLGTKHETVASLRQK